MIETNIILKRLDPTEGYVLTNGREYFPDGLYLAKNDSAENWHEITDAEYAEVLAEQEKAEELAAAEQE